MYKDKKYLKILVILGLCVLGLFSAYYFLFISIKNKNENTSVLLGDLSFQTNKEDYVASTNKFLQSISSYIDRINNSVISNTGDVEFIEALEFIARNNGLIIDIESLVLEDDVKKKNNSVSTLRFKATTEGSWAGTYLFLQEVESMPYKIRINQFSMSNKLNQEEGLPVIKKVKNFWSSSFEILILKNK